MGLRGVDRDADRSKHAAQCTVHACVSVEDIAFILHQSIHVVYTLNAINRKLGMSDIGIETQR